MYKKRPGLPKRPDLGGGVAGIGIDEEAKGVAVGASKGLAIKSVC